MSSPLVSLALLAIQAFTNNGKGKPVVLEYHQPRVGIESQAKCHLQYEWTNQKPGYTMTCVECSDGHYVTVYQLKEAVGAASVERCDKYNVVTSIRVVSDEGMGHSLEYRLKTGKCVRVDYQGANVQERECTMREEPDKKLLSKGYLDGWKLKEIPKTRGVVRKVDDKYKYSKGNGWCMKMDTWVHKDPTLVLRCFECREEYIAIVYKNKTPVGSAAVETCHTNLLEYSIFIDQTQMSNNRVRIQYQMNTGQCQRKRYEEIEGTYYGIGRDKCFDRTPFFDFKRLQGYRNGWRKKIQNKAKRSRKIPISQ